MKRSLVFLAFLLAAALGGAAQTTTVTAASGGLKINGNPVNGNVTISSQGPVAVSGGGLMLPSSSSGYITQCAVSAGAIIGTCAVPSSTLSNGGNGALYTVLVTDAFAGMAQALTNVSISGSSWALDQYVPPSTVSTVAAFTYTTGSGAPGGGCSSTSLYADTSGSSLAFYGCKGGSWVSVGTAAGNVTLSAITALGTLTNSISGNAATATALAATPSQCSGESVPTGIDVHGNATGCFSVSAGTWNGGTVATAITAPSVATNGTGPSGLTVTPNGIIPTAPANSIVYGVPLSVPTPYTFLPPTNVTAATSGLPMVCTYAAGPPATLTCTLQAVSGGGLGNGLSTGVNNGTYSALSWNGAYTNGSDLGFVADTSGSNKSLYYDVPTSGYHIFRYNNVDVFSMPTTQPSSSGQTLSCSTTSSFPTCVWVTASSGGGLGDGITVGQASAPYSTLSWNGNYADGTRLGFVAATDGSNKALYIDVPATGAIPFRIGGTTYAQVTAQGLWQPIATPADNATCQAGTYMGTDGTYAYFCTATNTVKRTAALSSY